MQGMARSRFLPDNFTLTLVAVVTLASLLPASGRVAHFFEGLTTVAIGLLFFLHGAKLSREAILAGITHWRLHLLVFACTFILFPVLGLALRPVLGPLVTPQLYTGVLFLCVLPATVQSAKRCRWHAATCRPPSAALRPRRCWACSSRRCW